MTWLGDHQLAGAGPYQAARLYYEHESEAFLASIDEGDLDHRLPTHHMHAGCRSMMTITLFPDADLPSEDVIERIESCIIAFLEEIFLHGAVPDISLVIYSQQSQCLPPHQLKATCVSIDNHYVQKIADPQTGEQEKVRKLIGRQGQGAFAYARIFPILQISHELLSLAVTASQRDVYYRRVLPSRCT